jgi:hypothetical protein
MAAAVRRSALIALAGAAIMLAAAVPALGHYKSYYSSLSLGLHRSSAGETFDGRVSSPKPICKRGRKVVVHKVKPGSDARIGVDVTGSDGKWKVDPPGKNVVSGRYYATMRSKPLLKTAAHRHICAPVTTPSLPIA